MKLTTIKILNILNVLAITIILAAASFLQFYHHELPCPLCLLQRVGILLMSIGFLMNLRFGFKPSHYGVSILAALFTAAVAGRQLLLHIIPGSGGYGDPFLGLYLYSWAFLLAIGYIIWCAIMLLFNNQFRDELQQQSHPVIKRFANGVFILILLVVLFNVATTFLECGLQECPSDPLDYKYKLF